MVSICSMVSRMKRPLSGNLRATQVFLCSRVGSPRSPRTSSWSRSPRCHRTCFDFRHPRSTRLSSWKCGCSGQHLACLDSDDEFLLYHLELLVGYLTAHPDRELVSSEFWECFGAERIDNDYRIELAGDPGAEEVLGVAGAARGVL